MIEQEVVDVSGSLSNIIVVDDNDVNAFSYSSDNSIYVYDMV